MMIWRLVWVCMGMLLPASGFFRDDLQGGIYGSSLGAGGGTAWERMAHGQNPAASKERGYGAYLGYHSPFGMDGLNVVEAGLHIDGRRWGTALGFLQTEVEEFYREQSLEVQFSWTLGTLSLGGMGVLRRVHLPEPESELIGGEAWGLLWRPFPKLVLGGFCRNFASRNIWTRELNPIVQVGFRVQDEQDGSHPGGRAIRPALAFDLRRVRNSYWRALIAHSLCIGPDLVLTAGLANRPFQFSVGAAISWSGATIYYAMRTHTALGRTNYPGLAFVRSLEEGGISGAAGERHAP